MVALSRVRDVSSNQSNPVHPVYRCKLTPVVAKLGPREAEALGQGLFKVPDGGLSPRTVIPAETGIREAVVFGMLWIPAFAGMTD